MDVPVFTTLSYDFNVTAISGLASTVNVAYASLSGYTAL